jgi:hypothetical protein
VTDLFVDARGRGAPVILAHGSLATGTEEYGSFGSAGSPGGAGAWNGVALRLEHVRPG